MDYKEYQSMLKYSSLITRFVNFEYKRASLMPKE